MTIDISIVSEAIGSEPDHVPGPHIGAEATFTGIVRGAEDGKSIDAIEYQAYQPMAERQMSRSFETSRGIFRATTSRSFIASAPSRSVKRPFG